MPCPGISKASLGIFNWRKDMGRLAGISGGQVTAPEAEFYGREGEWEVENHGVTPDVTVDLDPKLVREGHDHRLQRAVAVALEMLKKNPPPTYERLAYPNYHQNRGICAVTSRLRQNC